MLIIAGGGLLPTTASGQVEFSLAITNPVDRQFFAQVPTNLLLEVDYLDAEGMVVCVEFFNGPTLIGTTTNAPFSLVWSNVPSGTNILSARATDSQGATAVSSNLAIIVNFAPQVTLAQPLPNQTFALGTNIPITGMASDPEGAVTNIVCYLDAAWIGQNAGDVISLVLSNLALGEHSLTVTAEDNWGARSPPLAVNFEVIVPDDGIYDDFEPNVDIGSWSEFAGPLGMDVLATNYGGAVSGRNSLWFGGDDDRYVVTRPVAVRAGGVVDFFLRLAGGNSTNWNAVSLPEEGVALEYSINGVDWARLGVYDDYTFTNWQRVTVPIPAEVLSTNTQFRWTQLQHPGLGFSHWALDDVQVTTAPTPPILVAQPQDATVNEGATATFSVALRGNPPFAYRWMTNGVSFSGATNANLTLSNVTLAMSGWNIAVEVSNAHSSVVSSNALLTVVRSIVGYYTDLNTASTGPEQPILRMGMTPLKITNIATFNLDTIDYLFLDESSSLSQPLRDRLGAIQSWVDAGGKLIVHDRSAPNPNPFLLGATQTVSVYITGTDLDVIPPGNTPVISGPFGTINNTTLDGGNSSAHGYVQQSTLPPLAQPILSFGSNTNQVAAFSYPMGGGFIYYSTIPLDYYLDGNGSDPFRNNVTNLYAPNVLAYMRSLSSSPQAPILVTQPVDQAGLLGGAVTFTVAAFGTPPLSYQWLFEGQPLADATNATLVLTNAAANQAGNYQVLISNLYGSTNSAIASMSVVTLDPFEILQLGTNNAKVVDHNSLTGDDRGGIAVSATRVFYSGDSSTARFRLEDLAEGTRLGRVFDGLVSDFRTEQMYVLANGSTPIGSGTITTLLELDGDTGSLNGNRIALSAPITTSSGAGVFSGYGLAVIYTGTRVYAILLPSGKVMDLGAMTMPTHVGTENWAFWGVAEYFGGHVFLAYVRDNRTIVRTRVPDAATTTIATFNGLSDMACFTIVPGLNRWYFHYEGSGQFGGSSETIGYADATFAYTVPPIPPSISVQPPDRVTAIGGSVAFTAYATGIRPLFYQWQLDGMDLLGETNSTLVLSNLALSQTGGGYRVIVTNAFGVATSVVATLTVVDVGAGLFDSFEPGIALANWSAFGGVLGSTVYATNYGGSVSPGNALWFGNSGSRYAATRTVNTSMGGMLSFYLRLGNGTSPWEAVDLPAKGVVLEFSTNKTVWTEIGRYDTTNFYAWTLSSLSIPPAARGTAVQFRWRQLSNSGTTSDHWALDDVMILTEPTAPAINAQPADLATVIGATARLTVGVDGSRPLYYQWQFNGADLPDATNAVLLLSPVTSGQAGLYSVAVSNSEGRIVSANANLTIMELGAGFYDDFEPGIDAPSWSGFGGVLGTTLLATNYGGSVSLRNALWFGNSGSRYAATRTLNTSLGGVISFYLRLGFGASLWETVDLPVKGVVLEYSTNSTTWTEMGRYDTPAFYAWTPVITNIPAAAQGLAVRFRWRQLSNIGTTSDHWALDEVIIATVPTPPAIFLQPANRVAAIGGNAFFTVDASGALPLYYQWQFNGEALPDATNATLVLTNLTVQQVGNYSVVITNLLGHADSTVATLAMVELGAGFFDDFDPGLDNAGWSGFGGVLGSTVLTTNYGGSVSPGNALWFGNSGSRFAATRMVNTSRGGAMSFFLRLGNGTSPWETVDLPAKGVVLEFSTDATTWTEMGRFDTTAYYSWQQVSLEIPPAALATAVQFRWRQLSNSGSGYDQWALDDVLIATLPTPPDIYAQPVNTAALAGGTAVFQVGASGSEPLRYQWQFAGGDIPEATNATLTLSNVTAEQAGNYFVLVTNAYGVATSSVVSLQVVLPGAGFFDDFEPGVELVQWAAFGGTVGTTVLATNYGGSVSLSNSLWFGGDNTRFATTRMLDTSGGGIIAFYLRFGSVGYLWETADLPDEGVVLEYSVDSTNWTEMGRYDTTNFYAWTRVMTNIPPAAQEQAVQFRWRQLSHSGADFDHWALDDVLIATGSRAPIIYAQPTNLTVVLGNTASLSVGAEGSAPLDFQWFFEGNALPDKTNATLVLANVQLAQEGLYGVVITNALGAVTSATVRLTVDPGTVTNRVLLFGITNLWKYNQSGLSLGTTWALTNYNDNAWPAGQGILAREDNAAIIPYTNTVLNLTNAAGARVITYYFRAWRVIPSFLGAIKVQLISSNLVDDGAIFYLNGMEQARLRLAQGSTYATLATNATEGVYDLIRFASNSPALGVSNLLAVEVHQSTTNSTDVVFGMALYAEVTYSNRPPVILSDLPDRTVNQGQTVSLGVLSSGATLFCQWYFNGAPLIGQTNDELVLNNVQLSQGGVYSVVLANLSGAVTSRLATLTVQAAPLILQQPQNQVVTAGGLLTLSVTATGSPPLFYQWRRNGAALPSATNALLVISNAQPANAGLYVVLITNEVAALASTPTWVKIVGPQLQWPVWEATNGVFRLTFSSPPGLVYEIQASENLEVWTPLTTLTNQTGILEFLDPSQLPRRYYRLQLIP